VHTLYAAIAFHDSWAYLIHNSSEQNLPNINELFPPIVVGEEQILKNHVGFTIAYEPRNQMWMQGSPQIYLNKNARPLSRILDALACIVRTCCDQDTMSKNKESGVELIPSATVTAVMENFEQLCPRNLIMSASDMLSQYESKSSTRFKGLHLMISAFSAFISADPKNEGKYNASQVQSLLSVAVTIIEQPQLLYQCGPTYHAVSNCAILLAHMINGLHSRGDDLNESERFLFGETIDTYCSLRKVLNMHYRRLPVRIRCHEIPHAKRCSVPHFVDLIEVGAGAICSSKSCQSFIFSGCSPCVAQERSRRAESARSALRNGHNAETHDSNSRQDGCDKSQFSDVEVGFDVCDEELLAVLSQNFGTN